VKTKRRANTTAESTTLKFSAEFVSVKSLAVNWDCSRTTVSRILEEAGVRPYYFGSGPKGAKRYLKTDVERFLRSVPHPE